ncbi:MAG: hypothetical protein HY909_20020 [Deltaproteobacteria bacterium]|nr:hypothetical protein [Deltaproteobacteria bacterium]
MANVETNPHWARASDSRVWQCLLTGRREPGACFSPDDAWLAFAHRHNTWEQVLVFDIGGLRLACTLEARGPVSGLAFASKDSLLVACSVQGSTWVGLYAVPDGGLLAERTVSGVVGSCVTMSVSHTARQVLVSPWCWTRETSQKGAFLSTDDLAVVGGYLPPFGDAPGGVHAMVSLAPDGHAVAEAVGGSQGGGAELYLYDRGSGDRRKAPGYPDGAIQLLRWLGPRTVLILRGLGSLWLEGPQTRAVVVDAVGCSVLFDSAKNFRSAPQRRGGRGPDLQAWEENDALGAYVSVDLHPERHRLVLLGSQRAGRLQVVDLADGSVAPRSVAVESPSVALGVCWSGDALVTFTGSGTQGTLRERPPRAAPRRIDRWAMVGRQPRHGRITRSPQGRWWLLHWVDLDGPWMPLRVALREAAAEG